ncbi:MAG: hypothetical protein HYU28_05450 [Actinobacteria bacterium]|nr:hypothetical protein [Actinomycetota bacterium]
MTLLEALATSALYDAALGRFTSVDIIEGGTANDYAYVNDPVNDFDLTGTHKKKCKGIAPSCRLHNAKHAVAAAAKKAVDAVTSPITRSSGGSRSGSGGVGGPILSGPIMTPRVVRHVDVSAGGCFGGCVTFGAQGGNVYIQRGAGFSFGGGFSIGLASQEYPQRACQNVTAGGRGPYVTTGGPRDLEAGWTFGYGGGIAANVSYDDTYCRTSGG